MRQPIIVEFNGERRTIAEWADKIGVKRHTLYLRIMKLGWLAEKALTTPTQEYEYHGRWGSVEWNLWMSMKQRCTDQKCKAYPRYGGRGIMVCQEWLDSFQSFFDHMGLRPTPQHTLERTDNSKGYEPGNVVWATRHVRERNTRRNIPLTFQGRTMILKDWAREKGLANTTLWNRLFTLGWDVGRALTTPAGKNGRKK